MQEELKDSEKQPSETVLSHVAGVILAGGKSSRYGKNKAFEGVDGVPLIERVIRVMGAVFRNVILITNSPEEYAHLNVAMEEDLIKGLGPIGGIYTALSSVSQEAGFFVACDMPFLDQGLIRYMVKAGVGYEAVVPMISGKTEALHALYDKRCLPYIRAMINAGDYQVFRFYPKVRMRYMTEPEIRRFDPELRSFHNINRPGDLAIFKKTFKEGN